MAFANTTDGFAPGRATVLTMDVPDYCLSQEPVWRSLSGLDITGNTGQLANKVSYRNNIGWQLTTVHDTLSQAFDGGLLDLAVATGTFAAGFLSLPTKRANTDLTGVSLGSQTASGDNFYRKNVAAGDDWSSSQYQNSSDYSSFAPPSETEYVTLDRVFTGDHVYQPNDSVYLRFLVPELGGNASIGALVRLYFTGIPSQPSNPNGVDGTGQYAISFFGDGSAYLWEKLTTGAWGQRKAFTWCPPHQVAKAAHFIAVRSDAFQDENGGWHGRIITIQNGTMQGLAGVMAGIVALASGVLPGQSETQYIIPDDGTTKRVTADKCRVDVRRDIPILFQPTTSVFAASGTLTTQTFAVPRDMGAVGSTDPACYITFYGSFPAGTGATMQLYSWDGTNAVACSSAGALVKTATKVTQPFTRDPGKKQYYATITLTPDGSALHSPVLTDFSFVRAGVIGAGASTPFVVPNGSVTDYSIAVGAMNPMMESGSIGLVSYQDGFTVLANGVADPLAPLTRQSGKSVRMEVTGLPANSYGNTTSTLFLGKMRTLKRKRKGVKRVSPLLNPGAGGATQEAWPSETWWAGKMEMDGLWKRLTQSKTTQTFNFGVKNPATNNLYTVNYIVETLMTNAGLPSKMYDPGTVPDITLQADPSDKNNAYQVEVFTPAFEYCLGLVRDWMGATLTVDANATNGGGSSDKYGCLRLKYPPRPTATNTYLPLAQFVDAPNWTTTLNRVMNLGSYTAYTRSDGHTVPTCPVIGGSPEIYDEAPEGNCVAVFGTVGSGDPAALAQASGNALLWSTIHNWPAAQFMDGQPIACDPTHQDYTDGSPNLIVIIDPSLNTQAAVDFAARRAFDLSCHRRLYMRFEAPVVMITDPLDTLQIRQRPLRQGDAVYYAGPALNPYWFVNSVVINTDGGTGGTRMGTAIYELYQIPETMFHDATHNSVYEPTQLYAPLGDAV